MVVEATSDWLDEVKIKQNFNIFYKKKFYKN